MMARVNLKEYGNKQGETVGGCAVKMLCNSEGAPGVQVLYPDQQLIGLGSLTGEVHK